MAAMNEAVQVGKRQAIADWIANIQPDKTPFYSMLKSGGRPEQSLMTWQAEQYADMPFVGVLDGTAVTSFDRQDRALLKGAVQQFRQSWKVTKRAQVTDVAGVGRAEAGHQKMIAMIQARRQMEKAFLSANVAATESGATPWTTWGAMALLSPTLSATGDYAVDSTVRAVTGTTYTGAIASIAESDLRSMFDVAYTQKKAELDLVGIVGVTLRHFIDDLTGVLKTSSSTAQPRTIFRVEGNATYLNKVVDIEFSTGKATLITSPFIACDPTTGLQTAYSPNSGIFIDPSLWDRGVLDPLTAEDLPIDGSGPRGFVEAFEGLRCRNPLGQLLVYTNS